VQPRGRILVVESNDLILGLLERWLGEAGYTVAVGALQRLRPPVGDEGPAQLVIVDVPSPRNAAKIIESVGTIHAGPILLLSARLRRGTGSSTIVARQLGVRNVLPKPFTRDELLSAVEASIGHDIG
jgi:DNA-binding response OmpR family regulator